MNLEKESQDHPLPRSDVELAGYHIPADTHVISNLWAIHMDTELWHEPELFNPGRFLVNGRVHKPDFFMPFSVGEWCFSEVWSR